MYTDEADEAEENITGGDRRKRYTDMYIIINVQYHVRFRQGGKGIRVYSPTFDSGLLFCLPIGRGKKEIH